MQEKGHGADMKRRCNEQLWEWKTTPTLFYSLTDASLCWVASAFLVSIMMLPDLFFNTLQQLTSGGTSMLTLRKSFRKDGSVIILRRVSTLHEPIWSSNSVFCESHSRTATGTDTNFRCECVCSCVCVKMQFFHVFISCAMDAFVCFLDFFPSAFFF